MATTSADSPAYRPGPVGDHGRLGGRSLAGGSKRPAGEPTCGGDAGRNRAASECGLSRGGRRQPDELSAIPGTPVLGLASGAEGFDAAERILSGARDRLTPDGALFIELGAGANAFAAAHRELPLVELELERGGDGVLVTTAAELREFLRAR